MSQIFRVPVPRRAGNVFYGWWLVSALGVIAMVAYGSSQYLFGVLLNPVLADLGGSRGDVSSAYSVSLVVSAVLGVWVGRIVDRRGARAVLAVGCLAGSVSLLGLAASPNLLTFYLVWCFGIGTAMSLCLYPVTFVVVTNWFERRRGSAMALLTTVSGLSSPVFIPLTGLLISHWSWRVSLVVLAVCELAMVPVSIVFVRRRPEDIGMRPDGDTAPPGSGILAPVGHSLGKAVRTPAFWCLTSAGCAGMLATSALQVHQIPYMISQGVSPVVASSISGISGLASLPARVVLNVMAERYEGRRLLALSLGTMTLAVVVLCMAHNVWGFVVYAALFGLGYGGFNPLGATALADQFGRREYGKITAWKNAAVLPFSALGPPLIGFLADTSHSYVLGLLTIAVFSLLATLASGLTPAPHVPELQETGSLLSTEEVA